MSLGPWQVLLIAVVVLVLFGRGKISALMGEVGKGITSFKRGINEGKEELEQDVADAADEAKDVTPQVSETDKDKV
ncbi:MAG: twin-arginine translocase TatA/TatE family subunit [Pseudomonadota bacterium]